MALPSRQIVALVVLLVIWGCAGKGPIAFPTLPGAAKQALVEPGEKVDFFPTVKRTRNDIASLIESSEARVDATFAAAEDSTIAKEEAKELTKLQEQEVAVYQDFLIALDTFLQFVPAGGKMDQNLTKGRGNVEAKYDSYTRSIDAGIADQFVDPLEETAIESNARSLVTELEFIESSLPLPFDSLKVGPSFVIEADSVDLFFEVVREIEDMTKEIAQLRATIADYQRAKAEMEAFLEREKVMAGQLEKHETEIETLYSRDDTARAEREESLALLDAKLSSQADSIGTAIHHVDAAIKADISNLAVQIADSIASQKAESDSLFFSLGTNIELFREEIDSLKGVVRYYDIAEKGLPLLDEDVLNILKLPTLKHKITLKNGTIVVGQILAENMDVIIMQTTIGKLVIEKDFIAKYEEKFFPGPQVEFEGDYEVREFPDREEFYGVVRNIGKKRADFVKVTFYLWDSTTNPVGVGSALVDGSTVRFGTGVISDASIEPGNTAKYHVVVTKQSGRKIAYRTNEVKWREFD